MNQDQLNKAELLFTIIWASLLLEVYMFYY